MSVPQTEATEKHEKQSLSKEASVTVTTVPANGDLAEKGPVSPSDHIADPRLAHLERLDAAHHNGRLVVELAEARKEYGDDVASHMQLTPDGKYILWPQPSNDPHDPLNWPMRRKVIALVVITMAAFVPDFVSSIGIASLFPLATQFNTTTGIVNDISSNWSIFLLGWGGILAVMLVSYFGRLPVLFWSQIIGVGFLVGCAVAPDLSTFAAVRCLNAFFITAPQVTGLYFVRDMFFFHQEARMLNLWTFGFVVSPYTGPFLFGFFVQRQTWRWAYGIGCLYVGIVIALICIFVDETLYERNRTDIPPRGQGLAYRIKTLVGITGWKMRKYRVTPWVALWRVVLVNVQPQTILALFYISISFAWSVGINTTLVVFLQSAPPFGYEFSGDGLSLIYLSPITACLMGEIASHYLQDFFTSRYIRRHHGVFEPEARLWMGYIGTTFCFAGLILLGGTLEKHLSVAGLVFGWGMFTFGVMIIVSAIYTYLADALPQYQGEISCLINFWRTTAGFAVAYFQVPWAEQNGAMQTFGCESATVIGVFLLAVPVLQIAGKSIRTRFSSLSTHQ